jgi:hypothetical protein
MHDATTLRLLARWTAVVVVSTAAAPAQSQTVNYTGSVQYATGSYIFAERTHSVYLANGLNLSHGRVQASVSVPIIYQSSPWVSYSGVGGVPSGGPQQGAVGRGPGPDDDRGGRRSDREIVVLPDTATYADVGIGDPSLRADLTLRRGLNGGPSIRLAGSVKAPIADVDRGFGTGAWDGGLGAAISQRLRSWFLFGEAMHWWIGDMQEVILQNSVAYSLSLGRSLSNGRVGLLASLSGCADALVEDVDPPLQAGLGLSISFDDGRYGLSASSTFGLTESTPDAALAIGWQVAL